jgi:nitrous oxidase accessory protein NosD
MAYSTVPVTGTYVGLDGTAARGSVSFTGKVLTIAGVEDTLIAPYQVRAQLDATGSFSISLPATDDPNVLPNGWTYTVVEALDSGGGRKFELDVPLAAAGTGIDLSTVAPATAADGDPTAFATLTALSSTVLKGEQILSAADYADLPSAVAAATAATSGPSVLFLPRGTYSVDAPIAILSGDLTLRGEPGTLIQASSAMVSTAADGADGSGAILYIDAENAAVEGLSIDGNGLADFGIKARHSTNLRVANLYVTNTQNHGIWLDETEGTIIDKVTLDGCGDVTYPNSGGLYSHGSNNLSLYDCSATNNFQAGYYIAGGVSETSGLVMTGCRATNNGATGITARMVGMSISGCYSWGNGASALSVLQNSGEILPSDVSISGCTLGGSGTAESGEEVSIVGTRVVFSGNVIRTTERERALWISGSSDVQVAGNLLQHNSPAASSAVRAISSTGVSVVGNTLIGTSSVLGYGISLSAASDVLISGNRISLFSSAVRMDPATNSNILTLHNLVQSVSSYVSDASTGGTGRVAVGNQLPAQYEIGGSLQHTGTTAGFYNVTPTSRQTVASAATDAATTQTLVNDLRAKLIALGLLQ